MLCVNNIFIYLYTLYILCTIYKATDGNKFRIDLTHHTINLIVVQFLSPSASPNTHIVPQVIRFWIFTAMIQK